LWVILISFSNWIGEKFRRLSENGIFVRAKNCHLNYEYRHEIIPWRTPSRNKPHESKAAKEFSWGWTVTYLFCPRKGSIVRFIKSQKHDMKMIRDSLKHMGLFIFIRVQSRHKKVLASPQNMSFQGSTSPSWKWIYHHEIYHFHESAKQQWKYGHIVKEHLIFVRVKNYHKKDFGTLTKIWTSRSSKPKYSIDACTYMIKSTNSAKMHAYIQSTAHTNISF